MNRALKGIILLSAGYVTAVMFMFPAEFLECGRGAVDLCLNVVIPSLFPFFIFCGLFLSLGGARLLSRILSSVMRPVFNLPGAAALAYVLGIISGYPVGAVCASDLYSRGECTKNEAERMLAFCNNSGPLFVIGSIGAGMLGSPSSGRILYASHIAAAFLTGLIFRFYKSGGDSPVRRALPPSSGTARNAALAVGESVTNAIANILKVCAFVILFSAVTAALPNFKWSPLVHALLEITGGINKIAAVNIDARLKLSIISAFLAFSGVSVLCQVSSVVSPVGLSLKPYAIGKLIQGVIAFFLTAILFSLFPPDTAEVFAQNVTPFAGLPIYKQLLYSIAAAVGWSIISVSLLLLTAFVIECINWLRNRK